ncbi:WD40 repeat domain-containing serine/threonine protein kinase [Amycolatopsis rhizosphaerae]|uniref:WD40 repeat domain-containing serine/threonine protein kinase n=1 Tax=Amycolatopsis rhizosphaerae TaxID=2053003 RepID=UPI00164379C7|nr:WD40 repeat domain-containing serine/threonine protein kinase [Amycolatopsis rhizosphaerae]
MPSSSASNVPPTEAAPGLTLADGRYRLLRPLGRGGYGRVWLAQDRVLGVEVAVKEVAVPPGSTAAVTAEVIERATLEARHAARLRDHPNIVTVHDVLVERGTPWTVMQYVPGRSLADEIESNGPVPLPVARRVAVAMLSALSACHEAGVIHRDVKPHNIMLAEDGTPMLTDFGIAKATGQAGMTEEGMVVGSVAYIAPERAKGQDATAASDLFSLGVTLYHAVEGASPFDRGSGMATLAAVLLDDLPEPVNAGPLTPLIQGLTAKDPDVRWTAGQATALLDGQPPTAAPTAPLPADRESPGGHTPTRHETAILEHTTSPHRPTGRHAVVAVTALAAVFVALLIGGLIRFVRGDGVAVLHTLGLGFQGGIALDAVLVGALFAATTRLIPTRAGRIVGAAAFLLGATATALTLLAALAAFGEVKRVPGRNVRFVIGSKQDVPVLLLTLLVVAVLLSAGRVWAARRARRRPGPRHPGRPTVVAVDAVALAGALLAWALWPAPLAPAPPSIAQLGVLTGPVTTYYVEKVTFSADGRSLATVYDDQTVQVWDVAARRPVGQLLGPFGRYSWGADAALGADGRTLTTTKVENGDCVVQSWDAATGHQTGRLDVDLTIDGKWRGPIQKAALSAEGRVLAVTPEQRESANSSTYPSVQLWDVTGGRHIGSAGLTSDEGPDVKLSPDGRIVVTLAADPVEGTHLTLWDVAGQQRMGDMITLPAGEELKDYAFSPDGRLLVTASSSDSDTTTVRLWDVSSHNQARQPITIPWTIATVALSPDGHTLAAVGGALGLWNTDTGRQIGGGTPGTGAALAFSPDGRTLAARGDHGTLRLLSVPSS